MKPIQLRSNFIEVDFKDADGNVAFTIRFDRKDKNIERLLNFEKEFEELNKGFNEETATLEEKKTYVKESLMHSMARARFLFLATSSSKCCVACLYNNSCCEHRFSALVLLLSCF